jgi:hypothetical protein
MGVKGYGASFAAAESIPIPSTVPGTGSNISSVPGRGGGGSAASEYAATISLEYRLSHGTTTWGQLTPAQRSTMMSHWQSLTPEVRSNIMQAQVREQVRPNWIQNTISSIKSGLSEFKDVMTRRVTGEDVVGFLKTPLPYEVPIISEAYRYEPSLIREYNELAKTYETRTSGLPHTEAGEVIIPYELTPQAQAARSAYEVSLTQARNLGWEVGGTIFYPETPEGRAWQEGFSRAGTELQQYTTPEGYFKEQYIQPTQEGKEILELQRTLNIRAEILSSPLLYFQGRTKDYPLIQKLGTGAYKLQDYFEQNVAPSMEQFYTRSGIKAVGEREILGMPLYSTRLPVEFARGISSIPPTIAEAGYAIRELTAHPKESMAIAPGVAAYMAKGMVREAEENPLAFAGQQFGIAVATFGLGKAAHLGYTKLPYKPSFQTIRFPEGMKGVTFGIEQTRKAWTSYRPLITMAREEGKIMPSFKRWPTIDLGMVVGKEKLFLPQTAFESELVSRAVGREAPKITEARATRYYTVKSGVRPRELTTITREILQSHDIDVRAAPDILNILKRSNAELYGSLSQEAAARSIGLKGVPRTPRDFDIVVSNANKMADELVATINKRAIKPVVEPEYDPAGMLKGIKRINGEKLFDIHERELVGEYGTRGAYIAYGLKHENLIKTQEGIRTTTLSEQASRKLHGGMAVSAEERLLIPESGGYPVRGRIAPTHIGRIKDITDYYFAEMANIKGLELKGDIFGRFKAQTHLERWLEAWGHDIATSARHQYEAAGMDRVFLHSFERAARPPEVGFGRSTIIIPRSASSILGVYTPEYSLSSALNYSFPSSGISVISIPKSAYSASSVLGISSKSIPRSSLMRSFSSTTSKKGIVSTPSILSIPSFPSRSSLTSIIGIPSIPSMPSIPSISSFPSVPSIPSFPTILSFPSEIIGPQIPKIPPYWPPEKRRTKRRKRGKKSEYGWYIFNPVPTIGPVKESDIMPSRAALKRELGLNFKFR